MIERHLNIAAQAVRDLAAEQGGHVGAREAHDAWRWQLVSRGWKAGDDGIEVKQHPLLVSFEQLPLGYLGHALVFLEDDLAEQDDSDNFTDLDDFEG